MVRRNSSVRLRSGGTPASGGTLVSSYGATGGDPAKFWHQAVVRQTPAVVEEESLPSLLLFFSSCLGSPLMENCCTGSISAQGMSPCLLSVIYASNSFSDRNALWDDLRSQDPGDSMPWIIFGDFNCCRYQSEKSGGNAIPTAKLAPFNDFIFDSKVTEIPSTGIFLTWYNQRTVNPILIRLDRMLANDAWFRAFPNSSYRALNSHISDHSPLILNSGHEFILSTRFMFKSYWTNFKDFWSLLLAVFDEPYSGNPISWFYKRLKQLKSLIKRKDWASSNLILAKCKNLEGQQLNCQMALDSDPHNGELTKRLKLINGELNFYYSSWSSWIFQRSKVKWLSKGEDDLKFLFSKVRKRRSYNVNALKASILGQGPSSQDHISANFQNCSNLMKIIQSFSRQSGLSLNLNKSTLLAPHNTTICNDIAHWLQIPNIASNFTYLGIPISLTRTKISDFSPLFDTITNRLSGWNAKLLSFAGRVQFLKYTITNTVAYWMRGALIPKSIIKGIGKICAKFLYFGGDHSKRLHLISWNNTCKPHAKGGLGIASLKAIRHALNCAAISRFYNHHTPFSVWLRTRYSSPWKPPDLVDSALWKDICRTAISVKGNFKFINNDKSPASILWDHWCMGTTLSNLFPDLCCNSAAFLKWESVKDWSHNIAWVLPNHINSAFANDLSSLLSLIPLYPNATSNVVWKDNIQCSYKDFYKDYFERDDTVDWHKLVWHKNKALRFSVFTWQALLGGLKTVDNLARRNIHIPDPYCILCRCDAENLNHLFFECSYSFSVLTRLIPSFNSFYLRPSLTQSLHYVGNLLVAKLEKQGLLLTLNAIVYHLWRERNNRRYGPTSDCAITTANKVVKAIKYKLAHRKFSEFLEKWFKSE
ncbi:hypothetical protein M5K25_011302 [Dendrobium thyrsiflorum]|uniref:Reverse transcriptase zinc-binding domain-containing protein n=1 Tax=Dendrobium thyrsiflorum TaxID=117978 RepID=A0ABD0V347_DENTH